ncbi:MAG: hypothetical protein AAFP03_17145, partial [Cyanobacteria bacterium J06598_3]
MSTLAMAYWAFRLLVFWCGERSPVRSLTTKTHWLGIVLLLLTATFYNSQLPDLMNLSLPL